MAKKDKTGFAGSVLITLKAIVIGLILAVGTWTIRFLVDENHMGLEWGLLVAWAIFNLWFWGFLANRIWKWK